MEITINLLIYNLIQINSNSTSTVFKNFATLQLSSLPIALCYYCNANYIFMHDKPINTVSFFINVLNETEELKTKNIYLYRLLNLPILLFLLVLFISSYGFSQCLVKSHYWMQGNRVDKAFPNHSYNPSVIFSELLY